MRFATRLLPLAAVAATLSVAAQPALAADPACAPPSAEQQGLKTLASVSSTPSAPVVPGELVVRYRDGAAADAGTRRLAEAGAAGRRVSRRVAVVRLPKGQVAPRGHRGAAATTATSCGSSPTTCTAPSARRATPSSRSSGASTTSAAPAARRTPTSTRRRPGTSTTGSPSVARRRRRHRPRRRAPRPRAEPRREPRRVRRRPRGQRRRRRRQRLRRRRARLGLRRRRQRPERHLRPRHPRRRHHRRARQRRPRRGGRRLAGRPARRCGRSNDRGRRLVARHRRGHDLRRRARRARRQHLAGRRGLLARPCSTPSAARPRHLFVVAAGNNGKDVEATPFYPCAYAAANIVCVAATDANDALASFSNTGPVSVDLAAPGAQILSTVPGGGHALYSGTSMATPARRRRRGARARPPPRVDGAAGEGRPASAASTRCPRSRARP